VNFIAEIDACEKYIKTSPFSTQLVFRSRHHHHHHRHVHATKFAPFSAQQNSKISLEECLKVH
jgi:hypothetical protein